ncbi:MAG: hypothetical protein JWN04_4272 [Myxococcaceae bacterium]|nr:hypothetical protein [Myxococcaceae bacterium]
MDNDEAARRSRAEKRREWPIQKYALGAEPELDLTTLTPGERVAMVWQLTLDSWATMGAEIPTYTRAEAPGRVIRGRVRQA